MKRFFTFLCALSVLLSVNAAPQFRAKQTGEKKQKVEQVKKPEVKKAAKRTLTLSKAVVPFEEFKTAAEKASRPAPAKAKKASTEITVSKLTTRYASSYRCFIYELSTADATVFSFAFPSEGEDVVVVDQTYTFDDMYDYLTYWYNNDTWDYADFTACTFIKTIDGDGNTIIEATATDTNGDEWILHYSSEGAPTQPEGGEFVADKQTSRLYSSTHDIFYTLTSTADLVEARADILLPEDAEDVKDDTLYTYEGMDAAYTYLKWNGNDIGFKEFTFKKHSGEKKALDITMNITDNDDNIWKLTYHQDPQSDTTVVNFTDPTSVPFYYNDGSVEFAAESATAEATIIIYTDNFNGEFSSDDDDFDLDYSGFTFEGEDVEITKATATLTDNGSRIDLLVFLTDADGLVYELHMFFVRPTVEAHATIVADNLEIDDSYFSQYSVIRANASDDDTEIGLTITVPGLGEAIAGDYDLGTDANGSIANEDGEFDIYSGSLTITVGADGNDTITGTILAMNNTEYALELVYIAPLEDWVELGQGTLTSNFETGFGNPETVETVTVYVSESTPGLYAIPNPYGTSGVDKYLVINAEDPELIYFQKTQLVNTGSYGVLSAASYGGHYLDEGYDLATIVYYVGDGEDYWGKLKKNVISFADKATLWSLSNYQSGTWYLSGRLLLALPDLEAPEIINAESDYIGTTQATFIITATDDADEVDDMTFTIKNGDEVLTASAKTTDGKLTIEGLEKSTEYTLTLIATDRSGKSSDPYTLTFETPETDDTEAPVLVSAELQEVADKWATIAVSASDNETPAKDIVYVVTFEDLSSVELAAVNGIITLEGLTPETKYRIQIQAKDLAGNLSDPLDEPISFTTEALRPIELNIVYVSALYYSSFSSTGALNWYVHFEDDASNYANFDCYADREEPNAISGIYTSGVETNYIKLNADTKVKYQGVEIKATSATVTLEFLSYDEESGFATYNASFEMIAEDGNLYIGRKNAVQIVTTNYSPSGNMDMIGEVGGGEGIEDIVAEGQAVKVVRNNQVLILRGDKVYNVFGTVVK